MHSMSLLDIVNPFSIISKISDIEDCIRLSYICKTYYNAFNDPLIINILCDKFDIKTLCDTFPELIEEWDRNHYTVRSHKYMSSTRLIIMAATAGDSALIDMIETNVNLSRSIMEPIMKSAASNNHVKLVNLLIKYSNDNQIQYDPYEIAIGYSLCSNNEELFNTHMLIKTLSVRCCEVFENCVSQNNISFIKCMIKRSWIYRGNIMGYVSRLAPGEIKEIIPYIEELYKGCGMFPHDMWEFEELNEKAAITDVETLNKYIEKKTVDKCDINHMLNESEKIKNVECSQILINLGARLPVNSIFYWLEENKQDQIKEIFTSYSIDIIRDFFSWMNKVSVKLIITPVQINFLLSIEVTNLNVINIECCGMKLEDKENVMNCLGIDNKKAEEWILTSAIKIDDINTIKQLSNLSDDIVKNSIIFAATNRRRKSLLTLLEILKSRKIQSITSDKVIDINAIDKDIFQLIKNYLNQE